MNIEIKIDPRVATVFNRYPLAARSKMLYLREIILETAEELNISTIEETLKWGEPSYIALKGSTIRMDWKAQKPEQYALYFKCTSKLITSFRSVYGDKLNYEKNRAITFNMTEELPKDIIKKCIAAGLTYHKIKHILDLGLE